RASSSGRTGTARISVTKGTRWEACMRSATRRRGIEIFLTVPRILAKFPGKMNKHWGSEPVPRLAARLV
ncbi:hypothetical protein ABTD06_19415, partial [Acinetobacter baumannii]